MADPRPGFFRMSLWVLFAATVLLQPSGAVAAPLPEVRQQVLDNGATVLVMERHQAPVFASTIFFRVGSINEPAGATGVAHLVEHMAFKGTERIGGVDPAKEARLLAEIDRIMASRDQSPEPDPAEPDPRLAELRAQAAKAGRPDAFSILYNTHGATGMNASTSRDYTNYTVRLPNNRLPLWAAMETDRIMHPVFREFYTERDVVLEERRMRVDTRPTGKLSELFLGSAFIAHPYGQPVIGWPSDLKRLTRPQALAFFKRYYTPDNMVIAVVGDVDAGEVFELAARTFGRIPARPAPPPPHTVEPAQSGERRVTLRADGSPTLLMGYQKPDLNHPDEPVFDMIEGLLSGGRTSRLYRSLVLEQQLATGVWAGGGYPSPRFPHLFVIQTAIKAPHTPAEAEAAIRAELSRLATGPIAEKELERVRNQTAYSLAKRRDSNRGMAYSLAYFEAVAGDWRYPFRISEQLAAVTPDDIMRVARSRFVDTGLTVGVLLPEEAPAPEAKADTP